MIKLSRRSGATVLDQQIELAIPSSFLRHSKMVGPTPKMAADEGRHVDELIAQSVITALRGTHRPGRGLSHQT